MVKEVKSLGELEAVFAAAGNKAVLVDFYATWCGPCKMIAPKLEAWSQQYPNVIVIKVDVDEAEDVAAKYEISAMPTFKVFKNGQPVDTLTGANEPRLQAIFEQHN